MNEKDDWERNRVQRVVDYHNDVHDANIKIRGRTTEIYPKLEGGINWDWVCIDTETRCEFAIEVKRITDERLEEIGNIVWSIMSELKDSLSGKLPGTFVLYMDTSKNQRLQLRQGNRKELKRLLCNLICEITQSLSLDDEENLEPILSQKLSFALVDRFLCTISKIDNEGSRLYLTYGQTGLLHPEYNSDEVEKLEGLVSHTNIQLKQSNAQEKWLILIEEGRRMVASSAIKRALEGIKPEYHNNLDRLYLISGREITELLSPNYELGRGHPSVG